MNERRWPPSRARSVIVCPWLPPSAAGCDAPAVHCELDHTIPYAQGGKTHASNIKCYCKLHHLLKTFGAGVNNNSPTAR